MASAWVPLATPHATEEAVTMLGLTCSTAHPAPGTDPLRGGEGNAKSRPETCLLYTSPSPRD
eukprot:11255041-Alexandrium_andersonii.AAC.1